MHARPSRLLVLERLRSHSPCLSFFCVTEGLHQRKGAASADKDATYTWQDVAKHNTAKSAWVIIRGVVYDVTGAFTLQIL